MIPKCNGMSCIIANFHILDLMKKNKMKVYLKLEKFLFLYSSKNLYFNITDLLRRIELE